MSLTGLAQRMSKTSFHRLVLGLVFSCVLVGCSSSPSSGARVVDRNNAVPQKPTVTTGQYVVRKGDTLFSIAFRYGWDYKRSQPVTIFLCPTRYIQARRFASTVVPVQRLRQL